MARGLVHIYTGDGKGKTTSAMGLAFRAAGHDKKVYILQFLKGRKTGEKITAEKVPGIIFKRANSTAKFIFQMEEEEKEELIRETQALWGKVVKLTRESDYEIIIFDEIMGAITNQMVTLEQVIDLIKGKAEEKELVLTGRDAPQELMDLADYVTEMKMIKHPFSQKIPARKGIEF